MLHGVGVRVPPPARKKGNHSIPFFIYLHSLDSKAIFKKWRIFAAPFLGHVTHINPSQDEYYTGKN